MIQTEYSQYHVMNIGKLNNMGYNVDATIYMRELVPNSFITSIKLGYAYIYQDHKTETNILKSLYALEYLKQRQYSAWIIKSGTSFQLPGA